MSAINRPIPSQLDKQKVENMKQVLQIPGREEELTPIVSTFCVNVARTSKLIVLLVGCPSCQAQGKRLLLCIWRLSPLGGKQGIRQRDNQSKVDWNACFCYIHLHGRFLTLQRIVVGPLSCLDCIIHVNKSINLYSWLYRIDLYVFSLSLALGQYKGVAASKGLDCSFSFFAKNSWFHSSLDK